jgi:hypothetical protein
MQLATRRMQVTMLPNAEDDDAWSADTIAELRSPHTECRSLRGLVRPPLTELRSFRSELSGHRGSHPSVFVPSVQFVSPNRYGLHRATAAILSMKLNCRSGEP